MLLRAYMSPCVRAHGLYFMECGRQNERASRQQLQLLSLAAETMYFSCAQISQLAKLFHTVE